MMLLTWYGTYAQPASAVYHFAPQLRFLGTLTDLSLMVFDQNTKLYRPYGIDWVKYNVYHHLKKHAS